MPLPLAGAAVATVVTVAASYAVPHLIKLILASLGMAVITMVGMDLVFDYGQDKVMSMYNGLPSDLLAWADYLGAFNALSILFSAMNASLILRWLSPGVGAGKTKKIDFKD